MIAFYEVLGRILCQPEVTYPTDLTLLSTTTNALGLLSHPSRSGSYCTRLRGRFIWCTSIATAICNAREQQRKRAWVPILPNPNHSGSAPIFNGQRSISVTQNTVLIQTNDPGHAQAADNDLIMGESTLSSFDHSSPHAIPPGSLSQDMTTYDTLPSLIPTQADGLGNVDFTSDAWMPQYFGTQDLTLAAAEPSRPRVSDFMLNVSINPQMMTVDGLQHSPVEEHFATNF